MPFLSIFDNKNNPTPVGTSIDAGRRGEELARIYLESNGYRIVAANFIVPVGRNRNGAEVTGEIDIIAIDGETLCFVEVKTRRNDDLFSPLSNIHLSKQRQIIRAARAYRRIFNVRQMSYRYDAVGVVLRSEKPEVSLFKNFWTEDKFKARKSSFDRQDLYR
ncbi:MAG: YraN family protein [Acidobacteriota bacterium]